MTEQTVQIPAVTPEEQKKLVDDAIERLDRLAEGELEMARLFDIRAKQEGARRPRQHLIAGYGKSAAAKETRSLLETMP